MEEERLLLWKTAAHNARFKLSSYAVKRPLGRRLWIASACFLLWAPTAGTAAGTSPHRSLVQVLTTANPPDVRVPWRRTGPKSWTGSGVIIAGARILTAAHVVADQVMVEVRRAGSGRRYTATVEHVCHPCDLALLSVADGEFFQGSKALPIGHLPELQQPVEVRGFPEGGSGLAITSGIVSRIDVDYYAHSYPTRLLLVQVDAAINSGSSGGPAVSNGKLVGIAMQTLQDAENIGYIVPAPIVRHFLNDVKDGRFDGFPDLGFWAQSLENPALRSKLGLKPDQGGLLVTAVTEEGSGHGVMQPGDVLLAINGVAIGADGSVEIADGVRVDATFLEQRPQVGETLNLTLLRNGKVLERTAVMRTSEYLVPPGAFDRDLPYRVYAGFVFQPLTARYLFSSKGRQNLLRVYHQNPVMGGTTTRVPNRGIPGRREVVILTGVLTDELTRGYEDIKNTVILSIDGTVVRDLAHLSDLLDSGEGEFVTILTELGQEIVLERKAAEAAHAEILRRYQIPRDRADDLLLSTE